jgi:hypothetical protein
MKTFLLITCFAAATAAPASPPSVIDSMDCRGPSWRVWSRHTMSAETANGFSTREPTQDFANSQIEAVQRCPHC